MTIEEKNERLINIKKMSLILRFMIERQGLNTSSPLGNKLFFSSLDKIAGKSFIEVPQETLAAYSKDEYLDYQIALWSFRLDEYIVKSILRMEAKE